MRKEANYYLEKLAKSEATMVQKSKQLREVYRELMALSQEPYVVLLQVSMRCAGKGFIALSQHWFKIASNTPRIFVRGFPFHEYLETLNSVIILQEYTFENSVSRFPKEYVLIGWFCSLLFRKSNSELSVLTLHYLYLTIWIILEKTNFFCLKAVLLRVLWEICILRCNPTLWRMLTSNWP